MAATQSRDEALRLADRLVELRVEVDALRSQLTAAHLTRRLQDAELAALDSSGQQRLRIFVIAAVFAAVLVAIALGVAGGVP